MGVNALLALGFCAIGMTQATYDSSLTTKDDPPQVVEMHSISPHNLLVGGATSYSHLKWGGVTSVWLASNH